MTTREQTTNPANAARTQARRSIAQRRVWAEMPADERAARIALFTGLWDAPNRLRLSRLMRGMWHDYRRTARYAELAAALWDARMPDGGVARDPHQHDQGGA